MSTETGNPYTDPVTGEFDAAPAGLTEMAKGQDAIPQDALALEAGAGAVSRTTTQGPSGSGPGANREARAEPFVSKLSTSVTLLARIAERQSAQILARPLPACTGTPTCDRKPEPQKIWPVPVAGVITGVVLGAVIGLRIVWHSSGHPWLQLGWYGMAVSLLIGAKLLLSLFAVPAKDTPQARELLARSQVAAVITCRNEDPSALAACLDSLLGQTRPVDGVAFIDDASDDPACLQTARARGKLFEARGIPFKVTAFSQNLGKREGLAAGFAGFPGAFAYMCVDSDTVLKDDALGRLLRRMTSRKIHAVTGNVSALNWNRNLLTRLIDLRYVYAFLGERAAYSVLGSVLCVCGSLALYRGTTARKYAGELTGQRFFGKPCTYGDDRHMTFWCLKEGRVVFEAAAVAYTLVPERMGHFLKQQVRWSKSFFRESLWMLFRMSPLRACWWLTLIEVGTWLAFSGALVYSLSVRPALTGHFAAFTYVASVFLLSYARASHYTEADHPGMTRKERLGALMLAPLYGMIHVTLLLPLRFYALLTLRDNSWGTRKKVEVEA